MIYCDATGVVGLLCQHSRGNIACLSSLLSTYGLGSCSCAARSARVQIAACIQSGVSARLEDQTQLLSPAGDKIEDGIPFPHETLADEYWGENSLAASLS